MGPRRGQHLVGHRDGLLVHQRLDRRAGGDLAEQRDLAGRRRAARRQDLDGAALVVRAADVPLALEVGQVLVHRGERLKAELLRDLLEAGRVALLLDVVLQEGENFALALGQGHCIPPRRAVRPNRARTTIPEDRPKDKMPVTLGPDPERHPRAACPALHARRGRGRARGGRRAPRRRRSRRALCARDGGGDRGGEAPLAVGRARSARISIPRTRAERVRAPRGRGDLGAHGRRRSSAARWTTSARPRRRCARAGAPEGLHPRRAPDPRGAGGGRRRRCCSSCARCRRRGSRRCSRCATRGRPRRAGRGPYADGAATARSTPARGIVGVNSRDLDTFRIDTAAAWALLAVRARRRSSRWRRAAWPARPTSRPPRPPAPTPS